MDKLADNVQVADFYDETWADLHAKKLSGINSRHRFILKFMKEAGLKRDSSVLEIGCGLGTLTGFIKRVIPQGYIQGVDISPKSIAFAQKKYAADQNMSFSVNDMSDFSSDRKFDFVLFPDVLEHIPAENHAAIFKSIRKVIGNDSKVLINIPNPAALEYFHLHDKASLQIIDQPLHTDQFLKPMYENGLYLESLLTYSIFYKEPDYQWLVLRLNQPFKSMQSKSKFDVLKKSVMLRIKNLF